MTRYAVFVSTIPLDDECKCGESACDIQNAQDAVGDLWAQDGPPEPWLVNEEQLSAIEAALPLEKYP